MPRADKTLDRMQADPLDWRMSSFEAVAAARGVNIRNPGGKPCSLRASRRPRSGIRPGMTANQADLCPPLCCVHRGGASFAMSILDIARRHDE